MAKTISKTKQIAYKNIHASLKILQEAGEKCKVETLLMH